MSTTGPAIAFAPISARTRDAFEQAYRDHASAVNGLARRLLGDWSRAEEVTQEVFLRWWRNPGRYDPARGCLRTYLLTECHGRAVDAVRADSARQRREERDHRSSPAHVAADVAERACDVVAGERLVQLLRRLPPSERDPIALAFSADVTYQQVARMLGIPEGTAKARIRSGLRRLRRQLEDQDRRAL